MNECMCVWDGIACEEPGEEGKKNWRFYGDPKKQIWLHVSRNWV